MRYFKQGKRVFTAALVAAAVVLGTQDRAGAIVTYTGVDAGAQPTDPRPNSNAAASSFISAAATVGTVSSPITFESQSLGGVTGLTLAPGVTLTSVGNDNGGGVQNATSSAVGFDNLLGYNTTGGGANAYQVVGDFDGQASVTFSYATPIDAFGAYLSGVENIGNTTTINFSDGTAKVLPITGTTNGGVQYFGFTDAGASIASISVNIKNDLTDRDIFAVDDVTSAAAVPEPASVGLVLLGGGVWIGRRRRM